jgi:hypothetical protein
MCRACGTHWTIDGTAAAYTTSNKLKSRGLGNIVQAFQIMPRPPPGPSRLAQILQNLNKAPRATLVGVKSITLTLAQRNDHFGAR